MSVGHWIVAETLAAGTLCLICSCGMEFRGWDRAEERLAAHLRFHNETHPTR